MQRFVSTREEEITESLLAAVPKSTVSKSQWAMKVFNDWLTEWKVRLDDTPKVLKDVNEFSTDDLNYCLKYFYCDVRKQNGERYPPQSLKEMVASIQYFFNNSLKWNISLFTDDEFRTSREVLDAQMKLSARLGLVKPKRKANNISYSMENELWEAGSLGCSNPKQLLNSLIYFFGLHFSLRASQEHRDLQWGNDSQIKLKNENGVDYLEYTERMSKNKRFGLKCCRLEPKVTRLYPNDNFETRCPVRLYKLYTDRRISISCPAFYLTPLQNPTKSEWYKCCPMGIHSIQNATKQLTSCLNMSEKFFTNSSLRRTSQNRLIEASVPKEIIQKKTGRISEVADAAYIDSSEYEQTMSRALHGKTSSTSNFVVHKNIDETIVFESSSSKSMKIDIDGSSNKISITFS